jgi:peptidoglycan/xylan/chitin deacetylase (PgdA/CDA1 family)
VKVGISAVVDRLLAGLVGSVVAPLRRLSGRRAGLAVVYHVVADANLSAPQRLLPSVEPRVLDAHLRHLRAHYEVVPPSRLLDAVRSRRRGDRFPVAVTFDDDLRSHVAAALPVLQRLHVPAAFFLSGRSLDRPLAPWWDRLERAAALGVGDLAEVALGEPVAGGEPTVTELAETITSLPPDERDLVSSRLGRAAGPDPEDAGLRSSDVHRIAAAGFEVGFHTLRHDALPRLDDERLEQALTDGRETLAAVAVRELTMLAYPHGLADSRVGAAARAAGYDLGFTGRPEVVTASTDPLRLGRFDAAGRSPLSFALLLVRSIRRRTFPERTGTRPATSVPSTDRS